LVRQDGSHIPGLILIGMEDHLGDTGILDMVIQGMDTAIQGMVIQEKD